MNTTYLRYEMLRLVRNRQAAIFSVAVPMIVFIIVAASSGTHTTIAPGITVARYYFASMIAFGTLSAVLAGGARIAVEREVGWNRQLRLTPLPPGTYLRTKVASSYLLAIGVVVLLTIAALILGVDLHLADWGATFGLVIVALIPFAALGIAFGHLISSDAMGPVIGIGTSLFAIVGGAYFPIGGDSGVGHDLVRAIPSFWLVQAGKIGVGGQSWTVWAWVVVAAWTAVCVALAIWAYRRDTRRA